MTAARPLLLGVDGGGTTTAAWLADSAGAGPGGVLGRGQSGPSNAKAVGLPAELAALDRAIAGAFADAGREIAPVEIACLGLAGFGRTEERQALGEWAEARRLARRVLTVTDGALVVAAGTPEGWGVGVIAGTGSIAVGRDRQGRTARAGGWGHLFGDEGSAYAVVINALRRVARRADGREPAGRTPDPLTVRLCEAVGVRDPSGLVTALYAPGVDRTAIAALAPVVLGAAEDDPAIVEDLLIPAGHDLAEAAAAVARALGWPSGPLPLALAGGFLLGSEAVVRGLLGRLERSGYAPAPTRVTEPVRGALALARRALDEPDLPLAD
jgi:N-acetylglucosamine kinase-like BadF-type ATPase